VLEVLAYLHS
jgi:serine/threonine protein kinase